MARLVLMFAVVASCPDGDLHGVGPVRHSVESWFNVRMRPPSNRGGTGTRQPRRAALVGRCDARDGAATGRAAARRAQAILTRLLGPMTGCKRDPGRSRWRRW
jgi:hypothetical protein